MAQLHTEADLSFSVFTSSTNVATFFRCVVFSSNFKQGISGAYGKTVSMLTGSWVLAFGLSLLKEDSLLQAISAIQGLTDFTRF